MEWTRIVGALVAATALVATAARAQDADTQQANTQQANQEAASSSQVNDTANATAGETPGADGIPVPKPNPISRFMKEDKAFQDMPMQQSLVDDYREDNQSK